MDVCRGGTLPRRIGPSPGLILYPAMFASDTYRARRNALAEAVGDGLIVLFSNDEAPMNYRGNVYPYWQDGSVRYYGGPNQPGFALVLDASTGAATLYGNDVSMEDIVWTGPVPSVADLAAQGGIGRTAPLAELAGALKAAQASGRVVHFLPPYRPNHFAQLAALGIDAAEAKERASLDLIHAVVAQRERKSAEEIAEIEDALGVTSKAFEAAMQATRPGIKEYEVGGVAEGIVLAHGRRLAYGLICSVRGETLHNVSYDNTMRDGDLLLMDLGATSPKGYASDLTRTWPVSGRFSPIQRDLYDAVYAANRAVVAAIRPGVRYFDLHLLAARTMVERLVDLGLMKGRVDDAVAQGAHALFFPHGLGHQMGLDVHDMEGLGEDHVGYDEDLPRSTQFGTAYLRMAKPLVAGHVVTVEPGLYLIPALIDQWQAGGRFREFVAYDALEPLRGLGGIRIEHDVLVTDDGARVLGPHLAETADEIEALVGNAA